ncbi:hypothetical protein GQ42DRAFT_156199 [Ramicandelaber brevisporus]|nr:hypothetical protein GQ42DRAFT_156199 [Ramicandelaber brevisporus]
MKPPTKRARLDPAAVAAVAPVCQLFRLPRELLELVAVWFSRYEAVPVLAVNSTLHEIFAERIWRRLDTSLTQDLPIPQASLLRYGHLVRRMRVTELIPRSIDLAAAFPNIIHLWIPFSRLVDTVKLSQGECFERLSWLAEESHGECAAFLFSNILDTIPSAEQQCFTFPALQRLTIGTCCDTGNEVYSQFDFGKLFPSVCDLTLNTTATYCQGDSEDAFSAVLAHPWPSVRRLDVCGEFDFDEIMPHLAALSNVEELSMDRECSGYFSDWGRFNLCDIGRALPKLVRLKLSGTFLISAPQEQQQQQQQQQQLFRHLRYVSLKIHILTPSAISMLIRAPLLTGICLDRVDFTIDDDAAISDEDEDEDDDEEDEDEDPRRKKSPINLDFLDGVTNPAVRSVDINFTIYRSPVNYDDVFRAMLKCFVRLGVCTIQSEDKKALPGLHEEFPNVRFKRIE